MGQNDVVQVHEYTNTVPNRRIVGCTPAMRTLCPLIEVQTAVGLDVSLPCDLLPTTMTMQSDKVYLVIWYKEGNTKPIYSFDARGKSLQQAIHWSDEAVLKSKAYFYYDTTPPALRIKGVKQEDAGLYRKLLLNRIKLRSGPKNPILGPAQPSPAQGPEDTGFLEGIEGILFFGPLLDTGTGFQFIPRAIESFQQPLRPLIDRTSVTFGPDNLDFDFPFAPPSPSIEHKIAAVLWLVLVKKDLLCRVDFHKSPTKNCRIDLDVLVPPTKITILDELGAAVLNNVVGPYRENADINLTCISTGGQPTPKVTWWREHALLDDSNVILPDGTVKNVLYLEKLSRNDLHSVYTCQASNGHVVPPLSSAVKLDMKLPPLYVRMQGLRETLTAGVKTQVSCTTAGSRPAPSVVWTKGSSVIRGSSQTTSNDGNVTVSELVFVPGPEDNEKSITCSISYNELDGPTVLLKDTHILNVKHVPVISLALGAPLNSQNLMEGSDVYLECDIKANPPVKKIEWFHNNKLLQSARGIIVSNQTLVLQSITKSTHGEYMCRASNSEGTVNSNQLYLDIKYPPICKSEAQIIRAAVKQTVNITCDIDANPMPNLLFRWQFNNSLESMLELPPYTNIESEAANLALAEIDLETNHMGPSLEEMVRRKLERLEHSVRLQQQQQQQQQQLHHHHHAASAFKDEIPLVDGQLYMYRVDTFNSFGTITCTATNSYGQSGHCAYHILVADVPDPIKSCTVSNVTAYTVHISCVAGKDGGIPQQFHIDVFEESKRKLLQSISYHSPEMLLKKLPSDTKFIIKITPYNLQGTAPTSYRVKAQTLPAPLLRTAPSKAVLVQLTPLLGALVGAAITLCLVAVCVIVFVKFKTKKKHHQTANTEQDKGSAEPLSRNIGSHSSIDDKNPDVIPHENSEDDDEKQFERLTLNTDSSTLKYTGGGGGGGGTNTTTTTSAVGSYSPTHHHHLLSPTGNGFKKFGELSLTTNPGYAIYSSPVRNYAKATPGQTLGSLLLSSSATVPSTTAISPGSGGGGGGLLLGPGGPGGPVTSATSPSAGGILSTPVSVMLPTRTSPNIYTRLPLRDFGTPNSYDSMLSTSQTTSCSSSSNGGYATSQIYTAKMPLLTTNYSTLDSTGTVGLGGPAADKC
ncbi:sidestep protein [Anopheles darlingi]|uniref:Sidestep protein n=2 Tax=Nyssorhynchus TaxID=44543 RepID=W5J3E1_ANODA|nr:sidestep protein [Anopheles darlingi]